MEKDKHKEMSRRDFFKIVGSAGLVVSGLTGCNGKKSTDDKASKAQLGEMTYRTNPKTGDKVSLLGYGCMRWPTLPGEDEPMDQETINALVDHAIAHGVNYFDTSPAYCKGRSERATGIALARHPRDTYFIATKLSNFAPSTWSREASIAMYRNSFKELQTDYIDYLLLHGVGMGDDGMETLRARYIDNGVLDFLLEERRAGRIRNLGFSYHGDIRVFDYLLSKQEEYQWDFVQIQLNYLDWQRRLILATRMQSTCMGNWQRGIFLPLLWNRYWEDVCLKCMIILWPDSSSGNRTGVWPPGLFVLQGRSPGC